MDTYSEAREVQARLQTYRLCHPLRTRGWTEIGLVPKAGVDPADKGPKQWGVAVLVERPELVDFTNERLERISHHIGADLLVSELTVHCVGRAHTLEGYPAAPTVGN